VRVLVADDNPFNAELIHDRLEALGCSVDLAADGARAVMMASSGRYEALVLDVNMPVYDGVEVVRMLHHRPPPHPLRVVIVTADRLASRRAELAVLGIDAYLTKPVDLDRLAEVVGGAVPAPTI
jgi:two-component system, NarL family, capsular synthesis sensor histidine kinase RcsC